MSRLFRFVVLLVFLVGTFAYADERPRVALVLGGGGARGLAHVGVLKVLEEARIPVDCVIGTSIGALVGGLYASGETADAISKEVITIDWDDVLNDRPSRAQRRYHDKQDDWVGLGGFQLGLSDSGYMLFPKSALGTQKVDLLIRRLVQGATVGFFDDLPLPYRAVAADLESGDIVVLSRGDLAGAMRASMAVPGVFPPVERDTRVLIDGGIARNLPVDVARGVCGEVVIAVDVGSPLLSRRETSDVLAISDQTMRVLTQRNVDEQIRLLNTRDVLIRPSLGAMSSADFTDGATAQLAGEKAARDLLPMLRSLSVSETDYANWRAKLESRRFKSGLIRAVDVEPTRFVNPAVLRELLDVKLGKSLDVDELEKRLTYVYGRDDFEQIDYHLVPVQDGYAINLSAREKSWGPRYLDFGLGLHTDFEDAQGFQLSGQYKRKWLNSLGAEFKTRLTLGENRGIYSDIYQPLTLNGELFVALHANWNTKPVAVYAAGIKTLDYRKTSRTIGFDVGSAWGRWGEVRLGVERTKFNATSISGDNDKFKVNDGGVRFSIGYDQLDNAKYPREGSYARLDWYHSLHSLGAADEEDEFYSGVLDLKQAIQIGSWSFLASVNGAVSDTKRFDVLPAVGGLFKLSGYVENEIRAGKIVRTQIRASQDFGKLSRFLGRSVFWGTSLENARLWDSEVLNLQHVERSTLHSVALFIGSDTRIGPAYFALGYGDNKKMRVYLSINGDY